MTTEIEFYVYGVKHKRGDVLIDMVLDEDEYIELSFNGDERYKAIGFHGNILDLPLWCMDHNLQCTITKRSIEFPDMTAE